MTKEEKKEFEEIQKDLHPNVLSSEDMEALLRQRKRGQVHTHVPMQGLVQNEVDPEEEVRRWQAIRTTDVPPPQLQEMPPPIPEFVVLIDPDGNYILLPEKACMESIVDDGDGEMKLTFYRQDEGACVGGLLYELLREAKKRITTKGEKK